MKTRKRERVGMKRNERVEGEERGKGKVKGMGVEGNGEGNERDSRKGGGKVEVGWREERRKSRGRWDMVMRIRKARGKGGI